MFWRKFAVCLFMVCMVLLAGCEKEKSVTKEVTDIDRMQGTWKGVEVGGDAEWTLVIAGDKITADGPGPEDYVGTLMLDETMTPKTAILTINECAFEQYIGAKSNNLYKLEDGTLTIAGTEPGSGTLPGSFQPGNGVRVFELTKADVQ